MLVIGIRKINKEKTFIRCQSKTFGTLINTFFINNFKMTNLRYLLSYNGICILSIITTLLFHQRAETSSIELPWISPPVNFVSVNPKSFKSDHMLINLMKLIKYRENISVCKLWFACILKMKKKIR